jgi:hypothetical protein
MPDDLTTRDGNSFDSLKTSNDRPARAGRNAEVSLPACVRLDGEQMVILPTAQGIGKFALRVEDEHGELRVLTHDEELALAVAPGTRDERIAATTRVEVPNGGLQLVLLPQPWQQGDLESVMWQLERRDGDPRH